MSGDKEDRGVVRRYLLGELTDQERERFEVQMMSDTELFNEMLLVEEDLVEAYVNRTMSRNERQRFELSYMSTVEGREQVSFARALGRFVKSRAANTGDSETLVKARQPILSRATWFSQLAGSPYLRGAAAAVIVIGLGLGIWRAFFYQSEVSKGLTALAYAYRDQRPVEARISDFGYAPAANMRGGEDNVDRDARKRAERIILDAEFEHPSAATYHAVGKLYLADGKFDDAIGWFEKAAASDPNNAQLQSDYGVALLEKGIAAKANGQLGSEVVEFAKSLNHLSRALELDPNLLEALFNRALLYQQMLLPRQARADWETYLGKERDEHWAAEARQHLADLNSKDSVSSRRRLIGADNFVDAFEAGDEDRAWDILCANRDVISGQLIWEELVNSALEETRAGLEDSARRKLIYIARVGNLESKRTSDPFVSELATFYLGASAIRLSDLYDAHDMTERGRHKYLEADYEDASKLFKQASIRFEQAGDSWEAQLANLRIVHCYLPKGVARESLTILGPLTRLCEKHNYLWLLAHAYNSDARAQTILNESSRFIENVNRSVDVFEKIKDQSAVQKGLAQVAFEYGVLGNFGAATDYLDRCMISCANYWPGPRQAWRNYDTAATILCSMGLGVGAAAFEQEALQLCEEEINDASFTYLSYARLGAIYGNLRNTAKALAFAQRGLEISRSFPAEKDGSAMVAFSLLQLGHIYRMSSNLMMALDQYNQAIDLSETERLQVYLYEAHKGRLLCYFLQQDDGAVGEELVTTLKLFDQYRSTILEEHSRNTFFDQEQDVYDIAIDFEASRMNNPARAFEYSEESRARSLLAMMNARPVVNSHNERSALVIQPRSALIQPLTQTEITDNFPAGAQVIQYAVLDDKVLMWVLSRKQFRPFRKDISIDELTRRVDRFTERLQSPPKDETAEDLEEASELYRILIEPVSESLNPEKVICFVPDKILNRLSFGALYSKAASKRLLQLYTVMTSPSATVFTRQSQAATNLEGTRAEKLLGIGDPDIDHSVFNLSLLQSAVEEIQGITAYYHAPVVLTHKAATVAEVKLQMQNADVIHFATHYVINQRQPQLSGVPLAKGTGAFSEDSDSTLRCIDILKIQLVRTRVVVLAACQTGVDRYFKGEGAIGFSRAFLAAGVPIVVASLWPVDSDATRILMVNFHRYRTQGCSTVKALQCAQVDMLNDPGNRFGHPFYWASFIAVGGYCRF